MLMENQLKFVLLDADGTPSDYQPQLFTNHTPAIGTKLRFERNHFKTGPESDAGKLNIAAPTEWFQYVVEDVVTVYRPQFYNVAVVIVTARFSKFVNW
jgi:hypothetical protein